MEEVVNLRGGLYMLESLMEDLYDNETVILREVEEEGGGMMRYIKSSRAKMRINESTAKKQGRIDLGKDVVVGVNNYRIDKNDRDGGNGNGDGCEGGEDATDALRIDNTAMRESHTQRLGDLRANRDEKEVREALNLLERSAALSKDDENDDTGTNNSNNGKNGDVDIGGRRR